MTHQPAHPEPVPPVPAEPAQGDDGGASRRAFLAGAGAATVVGAAAAAGGLSVHAPASRDITAATAADGAPVAGGTGSTAAVVAYVRDAAGGEVRLMSGEREVVVHDRSLARTLTRHFDEQEG